MNRFVGLFTLLLAIGCMSCKKKDVTCECTKTTTLTTNTGSVTVTDPVETIELKNISKGEAKSICQRSTKVTVNGNATVTELNECELN